MGRVVSAIHRKVRLNTVIHPVVLCGGSGTRLWPLSRKSFPKQFVPLVGGKSLLQLTLERTAQINPSVICIAAEDHRFLVAEMMDAARVRGRIILEPEARNTAAAMALAALTVDPEALLLFCPADHHIPNVGAFTQMVERAVAAALDEAIVTFGVVPSFPSTAYGYIQQGDTRADGSHGVARFIEKPALEAAQALLLQGNVLWNAGIFLVRASKLIQALQQHAPDILQACRLATDAATQEAYGEAGKSHTFFRPEPAAFKSCRAESIDYAVMEQEDNVVVAPFESQWSDVGSWNAVAALTAPDAGNNRIYGHGMAIESSNTFIHAPHRLVVALGTRDILIIDTPDALLVTDSSHTEMVKAVVSELDSRSLPQAVLHRRVSRPWGDYDCIDEGQRFKVKRITVKPGASLSLQKHHHRAEHWIVVQGTAEVTRGKETFLLSENQSTYIPIGEVHRLRNPGKTDLAMIEVQSGSYLEEDDIVRFEDTYGR
jgi:mannose-1-phosphate guanylyltransferase/mannose-6-phosphate isomerase